MTRLRGWTTSNFGLIGPPTVELAAIDRLKKSLRIMRKQCLHFFSAVLDQIVFILAGNDNIHETLGEIEIQLDLTTGFHGKKDRVMMGKRVSKLFLVCFFSSVPFHTCR